MFSPLRANHLVARPPSLSLNSTRNSAFSSNEVKRKLGRPRKSDKASKEASEPLPSIAPAANTSEDPSLNHYFGLPPLPPADDWLSQFAYTSPLIRDRISIRAPLSAISVARSIINSKKISTNNPKVIIEAFPGVRCLKAIATLLSHTV